jgi:hypothetical protein
MHFYPPFRTPRSGDPEPSDFALISKALGSGFRRNDGY